MPIWALIEVLSTIEAGLESTGNSAWIRKERAFDVDRDRAVESLLVERFDRPEIGSTGIDEQDVEMTEGGFDGLDDGFLPGNIAGIGLYEQSRVAEHGTGRLYGCRIGAGDRDAGALGDELAGRFKADTAGAAGDQGCLVEQA